MAFRFIQKLKSPEEIKEQIPLGADLVALKQKNDQVLRDIFTGKDSRLVCIIGPCSAHDPAAVMEYTHRLARLQEEIRDSVILVPRVYTNKPRTLGVGYKGLLHQPDLSKKPSIAEGIQAIRQLHCQIISETHLPLADEMLYPENHKYVDDLLSYVAVGARSVENQEHRLTASGVDIPVGMKNTTGGNTEIMLNSVEAAQAPHIFAFAGYEVETNGNDLAHTIMRGFQRKNGEHVPNYHYEDLHKLVSAYGNRQVKNPGIIVDANHSNSGKRYGEQPRIVQEVLNHCDYSPEIRAAVKGFMVESFLVGGNQKPEGTTFGQSITDPCLGWDETEALLRSMAERH
ncbi:3-deoxy-7-phosphoheptulonate synthase [Chitinivibrio alkaliphilus]|uniref:Phospho-2-dehydro-3-deoxyheptonate aldolase n=1 Tax=Chitinivibrio alkaliphilus ACht1 TaxID=1313304 RepID=U7DC06_9BACT|nr:3-deoxy-7-phosphoheptulonate synthase [Chitinivibrio alkaliphilus]ERP39113.1 phospho-2-dehydro-3-deoxyheptonate aldolase [Chitinivibrio alkaliphilus ACht1]